METTIAAVGTGETLAILPGSASGDPAWGAPHPVVAARDGFVAVLLGAPDCDGAAVYGGAVLLSCIQGAESAAPSPDGSRVIAARKMGETGRAEAPGWSTAGFNVYDIVLVELETGEEKVVASGALSGSGIGPSGGGAPGFRWNDAGSHVLIRWPFPGYGL